MPGMGRKRCPAAERSGTFDQKTAPNCDQMDLARDRWLYLAVILGLHPQHVIGWAVSNR